MVTLVLAMVLTLSAVACGSSSEPKQEDTQQETEQEESTGAEQADNGEPVIIEEQEDLYIYDCIYESDKKFLNLDNFNPNDDTPYHLTESLDLYLDTGTLTGVTKPDTYVNNVRRSGDGWVFIPFRQTSFFAKEEEFDKLAEKISLEEYNEMCAKLYTPIDTGSYEYEEYELESSEQESQTEEIEDPYQNIIDILDELIDDEKVYTTEEVEEIITELFNRVDYIKYNSEMESGKTMALDVDSKGTSLKYELGHVFYAIYGSFGWCEEMKINVTTNGEKINLEVTYTYE